MASFLKNHSIVTYDALNGSFWRNMFTMMGAHCHFHVSKEEKQESYTVMF
jgi:hypothetical protein